MKKLLIVFVIFVFLLAFPGLADKTVRDSEEATHILVGEVIGIESYYDYNEYGDYLIFSRVTVRVDKELKGKAEKFISFTVEGGEVGEMGLRVSNTPVFKKGEVHKLYLKKLNGSYKFIKQEKIKPEVKPRTECCATFAKWPSNTASFYLNPNCNDMSSDCTYSEINLGSSSWQPVFYLVIAGTSSMTKVRQDFQNIVFFRKAKGGNTIAVTYTWYYRTTGIIIEFDMTFYDGWKYFSFDKNCTLACNGGFYLSVIAAHEFGHALGLDHNDCTTSIMYPYADYCETGLVQDVDLACADTIY